MIGLIADIHGNYAALDAVVSELDRLGVADVICLGDVCGYYSEVNACCELLQARAIPTLQGNHDWYIATGEPCPRSRSANDCLEHQRRIITDTNLAWVRTLSPSMSRAGLDLVHGGWIDPIDEYLRPSLAYFSARAGRYFASGHTHVQYLWSSEDKVYCNPGSVGQPRDGDWRAAFALFDGKRFELHRVAYDVARTQAAMQQAGFDAYYYKDLARGARIGGQVDRPPEGAEVLRS